MTYRIYTPKVSAMCVTTEGGHETENRVAELGMLFVAMSSQHQNHQRDMDTNKLRKPQTLCRSWVHKKTNGPYDCTF